MSKTTQTALNRPTWTETNSSDTDTDTRSREIPRPDIRDATQAAETGNEDPSAAKCAACDRHLPHGTPDIGRVLGSNDGTIPACARPDCDGIESRSVEFRSHTQAALHARSRDQGARTEKGGDGK